MATWSHGPSTRPAPRTLLYAALAAAFVGSARAEAPPTGPTGPTGPLVALAAPPERGSSDVACSLRHPVCVHAPDAGTRAARPLDLAVLAAADRAWDVFTGALALPPPRTDLDGALSFYLADDVPGGGRALLEGRDPRARFDEGASFGVVDRGLAPGCALDLAVSRALAEAILLRAVPGTDAGSRRAEVESLARVATPCTLANEDVANDIFNDQWAFQAHPELALVERASPPFDRGASLFFDWLEAAFAREPAGLIAGLWSLSPTRTPPSAWRWSGAPTVFDVLGASARGGALGSETTLEELFVRFALERPFQTPPAREAWHVPWPSRARRLASPEPVYPSGASYVVVDHAGAPPGAKLRVEAQWEDYARMRWAVMKLDASGRRAATLPLTSLDRGTQVSLTVESLDATDRLVVVGVNVGSTEHPFDADQGEWEPHGWLLTLEGQ